MQRRDRLRAAPADGAVIAIAEGEPLPRVPRRGVHYFLREGSQPQGRDAARLGSQEPDAAPAARAQNKNRPKEEAQGTRISSQAFVSAS